MADFDPYHKWLGIAPSEQPANHYRLLGLRQFEDDPDVIENAADQRMAHLRSLQNSKHATHSQKLLSEIATARGVLLHPQQRDAYNAKLKKEQQQKEAPRKEAPRKEAPIQQRPAPQIEPLPPVEPFDQVEPFDPLAAAAQQPQPYAPPAYSAIQPVQPFNQAPGYGNNADKGSQTGMIVMAVVAIAGGGLLLLAILVALAFVGSQTTVVSVPPDGVELDGSMPADSGAVDGGFTPPVVTPPADGFSPIDSGPIDPGTDGFDPASDGGAADGSTIPPVTPADDDGGTVSPPEQPGNNPPGNNPPSGSNDTAVLALPPAIESVVPGETPFAIDYSTDGAKLAIGGSSGAIHFFDVQQQKFEKRVQVQNGWTWDVDYAPNNALAVSGGFSRQLYVLDPQGRKVFTAKPHGGKTRVVEYSPDGSRLALASDDKTASIHDTATGRQLFKLPHSGIAIGAGFTSDGRTLVTGGGKGHLRFWNVATGRSSGNILNATASCIWCLACSSQGVVAAGDEASNFNLYQIDNRRPLHKKNLQSGRISGIDFTSDGRTVACATEEGGLYVFDVASGKQLQHIPANGQKFTRLKFSPDDQQLALLIQSGKLLIYRVSSR